MNKLSTFEPLLDGLPIAALIVDDNRKVLAANRRLEDMVAAEVVGRHFVRVLRHPEALRLIDRAADTRQRLHAQVTLEVPVHRVLDVTAYALPKTKGMKGLVLVTLSDISALYEVSRTHSSFVANVSHELRSPLATISGILETLQGPAKDDKKAQERFLALMQDEASRMSRLINDLLSLSKLEARAHQRPEGHVDACSILARVVNGFSLSGKKDENRIHLECDADMPELPGDADELYQIFQNLVENAIKYSQADSPIQVRAIQRLRNDRKHGEGKWDLVVEVEDRGEGIEGSHIPRLTERFYRVDKGRSREMGGTGLGLAICKHIVGHHRGTLQIKSQPGEGTRVTVTLPGQ